jgi:PAS domain S-box-containing protein
MKNRKSNKRDQVTRQMGPRKHKTAQERPPKIPKLNEEQYRSIVEQSDDGIVIVQDDIIKYVNPALAEMAKCSVKEMIHRPFTQYIHPDEILKIRNRQKKKLAGKKIPSIYESAIIDKYGRKIVAELNVSLKPFNHKPAFFIYIRDITGRKKTEKIQNAVYRISEAAHSVESLAELYRTIHETIAELVPAKNNFYIALYDEKANEVHFPYWVDEYDEKPTIRKLSNGMTDYLIKKGGPLLASQKMIQRLFEKGEVSLIGKMPVNWLGVPLKIKGETIGALVAQSYTKGDRFKVEDKAMLIFMAEQAAMAIERKLAGAKLRTSLKEKEILLMEIHHRVKNNLQIISSLLNLQSKQIKDQSALEMYRLSQNRVFSMSLVHEKLYSSNEMGRVDFKKYIRSLTNHLLNVYGVDTGLVKIDIQAENIFLDINTSIPCGLIINELVSNSLKHGFPDQSGGGKIHIELKTLGEKQFQLMVSDNGIGLPEEIGTEKPQSLGLQLVHMLVEQLQGKIAIDKTKGVSFQIIFSSLIHEVQPWIRS